MDFSSGRPYLLWRWQKKHASLGAQGPSHQKVTCPLLPYCLDMQRISAISFSHGVPGRHLMPFPGSLNIPCFLVVSRDSLGNGLGPRVKLTQAEACVFCHVKSLDGDSVLQDMAVRRCRPSCGELNHILVHSNMVRPSLALMSNASTCGGIHDEAQLVG